MNRIAFSVLVFLPLWPNVGSPQGSTGSPPASTGATSTSQALTGGVILYDNGSTDPLTDAGNEMTAWVQADDFELSLASTVSAASIDWLDQGAGSGWDGGVHWYILSDASGLPGSIVAEGIGLPTSTTLLAALGSNMWWTTCFDFDVPVVLAPSVRYWFGVHFASDKTYIRDDIFLAYSGSQSYSFSAQSQGGLFNNWLVPIGEDRAFRLFGDICDLPAAATLRNDGGNTNLQGYTAGIPVLGRTWTGTVDNALAGNSLAGIVGFVAPVELFLPLAGDYLLVDVMDPGGELLALPFVSTTGLATFTKAIPPTASLCGVAVSTQGFGVGGASGITLHNAFDLILGA